MRAILAVLAGASFLAMASVQACGTSSPDGDADTNRDAGHDASTSGDDASPWNGRDGSLDGASTDAGTSDADGGPLGIPSDFFGLHVNHESFPVQVPYGAFRFWDTPAQWATMETCDGTVDGGAACFHWDDLDTQLAALKAAGVDETLFTLSRTPAWAAPTGIGTPVPCDYGGTTCYPPRNLAADGSGADDAWIGWVTALSRHVNAPGYSAAHARIHVYEPWNEFYRAPVLSGSGWDTTSYQGTFAQLVRMTEDLRCVLKGAGTVHNYPAAGGATSCAAFLAALGQTATDPDALVSMPSGEYGAAGSGVLRTFQNFLYCSADASAASGCTTGSAGSAAVDIINEHLYPQTILPETSIGTFIPATRQVLSEADLAKPLISGEGSWGLVTVAGSLWDHDPYERAGFIPRYFALGWSAGLTRMFWYAYDNGGWGQLYSDDAAAPGGGDLKAQESTAWTTTSSWLVGAVPTQSPFCAATGTVYTCDFLQHGTVPSRLVWDSSYSPPNVDGGHGCLVYADAGGNGGTGEWTCGNGTYAGVTGFTTVQDLSGAAPRAITGGAVTIGANPVLLQ